MTGEKPARDGPQFQPAVARAVRRLIAATTNPAKITELMRIVAGCASVVSPPTTGAAAATAEPVGPSFEALAAAKAASYAAALGAEALVVASDGGLLVPALGSDWNPLLTHRFAGDDATDVDRANALLRLSAHLAGPDRRIAWREAVAVARGGAVLAVWVAEGTAGELARDFDRNTVAAGNGFWLPALWLCPECGGRRLASLTTEERLARDDHWSRLGRELRLFLSSL